MTSAASRRDLIVLTADLDMKLTIRGLLNRHKSLGIRAVTFEVISHPEHDPGVFKDGHNLLQAQSANFDRALIICDRDGCGQELSSRQDLETVLQLNLARHWPDRSASIVIEPELEAWIWTDSPHLVKALRWDGDLLSMHRWLTGEGLLEAGSFKPSDPKTAVEKVLRYTQKKRSSSVYEELAANVSLSRCIDPAFLKLLATLRAWFPC